MSTRPDLVVLDAAAPRRLAVVGDPMLDVWVVGQPVACQDGCPSFRVGREVRTPGGAAGAANQLARWPAEVSLIAPVMPSLERILSRTRVEQELCFDAPSNPVKTRHVGPDGRIHFRRDDETPFHGQDAVEMRECCRLAAAALRTSRFDGVLVSDYAKGFLGEEGVRNLVRAAGDVPVVADLRCSPTAADGRAVLKVNEEYSCRYPRLEDYPSGTVITRGAGMPQVRHWVLPGTLPTVVCVNHVGAGDSFAAHLLLALSHGLALVDAAAWAHAAGRVYVQHPFGRPPWPHEVARDLDPLGGKVVLPGQVPALGESLHGRRVVFTNGVFRLPHAGHAWLLDWARRQGDVLVVGVNDDASAARVRPGESCLPLAERLSALAAQAAVDWVVPFAEDDPCAIIQALGPVGLVLVKGHEYRDTSVPGSSLVQQVLFAPSGPHPRHVTDILAAVVESVPR